MLDDGTRESDEVNYGSDDPLDDYGDDATDLLSSPTSYITDVVLGIVVGGFFSVVTLSVRFGLDIIEMVRWTVSSAGSSVSSDIINIQGAIVAVLVIPLEVYGSVATSAGPFAPIVAAGAFALTAATVAAVVWTLYRIVRFI